MTIKTFEFIPGLSLRVVEREGEPWFVAKDVCNVLGIANTTQAAAVLDPEDKAMFNIGLRGSAPTLVNEPGLFALVLRSRKPEAKTFQRWVTKDVLPAIRRTGGYMTPEVAQAAIDDPAVFMAKALVIANDTISRLNKHAEGMDPTLAQDLSIRELCREFKLKLSHGERVRLGHAAAGMNTVAGREKALATRHYITETGKRAHEKTRMYPRAALLRAARAVGVM